MPLRVDHPLSLSMYHGNYKSLINQNFKKNGQNS